VTIRRQCLLISFVFAFLFSVALCRADATPQFETANRLFAQGKFAEAAASYEAVVNTGAVSPALYFNLGNARFKSGEIGKAIAAFRKAEQLAPRDPDLQANLRFVRNQVQGSTSPISGIDRWLIRMTLNEWTWLAAVPFWICLLLLTAMQFRRNAKAMLGGLAAVAGALSVIAGMCLLFAWKVQTRPSAVVIAREAVVRNGPLEESQSAFTLRDGSELQITDQKDGWLQISVGNRNGWVKREQVEVLQMKSAV
jgi:tetratricopeptide (TPR) repeat protein